MTATASSRAVMTTECGSSVDRGRDWADKVPLIVEALMALRVKSATLDGEGVVCDERGLTDFDRLRSALGRKDSRDAFLYALVFLPLLTGFALFHAARVLAENVARVTDTVVPCEPAKVSTWAPS
jgi:hypothetical protein